MVPVDSPHAISIFHRFRDIITYFPKFKDVTWPWKHVLQR